MITDRFKLLAFTTSIIILLIIGTFIFNNNSNFTSVATDTPISQIHVYIVGSVNKPGVYSLTLGSTVEDALKIAGGTTATANLEYIDNYMNLARKLIDGDKIRVLSKSDKISGYININLCNMTELTNIPSLGIETAKKIINSRPYLSVEELKEKKILSESQFAKYRDYLVI